MDNKLKEFEGVDDLGSMDPRELCLVHDVVIQPKFKMPNVDITGELRAFHRELHGLQSLIDADPTKLREFVSGHQEH